LSPSEKCIFANFVQVGSELARRGTGVFVVSVIRWTPK